MTNSYRHSSTDANPPIIIIGMHRSGTGMIASMLRELGVFIGNDLESNFESCFFINHNAWLLHQCGSHWDNPYGSKLLYENPKILRLTDEYIRQRITGLPVIAYLGWKRFLAGSRPLTGMGQETWGWKDPRNTYTLPYWLRLFPDARVIHIHRNGVAVAASLRARERKNLQKAEAIHMRRKAWGLYNVAPKMAGFAWSNRCWSLEGGFSLWEDYVETAMRMTASVAPHALTLRYEDFVENPAVKLLELAQYCMLNVSEDKVDVIAAKAKQENTNAYELDEELANFYDGVRHRPLMEMLGYGKGGIQSNSTNEKPSVTIQNRDGCPIKVC